MEKETARIEGFSDGVFAIAITLLVLELRIPVAESNNNPQMLANSLLAQWPSFLAFSLSFFSIFIMWVNHHKIFKQIYRRNSALMFANGLILFLATCISYPTALLARYFGTPSLSVAVAAYTGLFVLINLAFNLLWGIASRNKDLLRPEISHTAIRKLKRNYLYGLPVHLSAFLLSFCWPGGSLVLCALLWTYWAFTSGRLDLSPGKAAGK
ncbi:TMEM175 family protein [Chitinophaga sp. HK235]|uniref:TMEM175 family protein n=1 Tax=Chitinophaga sp. HK235 TaxID=2952571 RepID=UPI001BA9905A|nr:TMEM175 family protein [Chitinophaga sp. HK235]